MAKIRAIEFTQDELKQILDYNPETGLFKWKVTRGRVKAGDRAGTFNKHTGYWKVNYELRPYSFQRLAWFYIHGFIPMDKFIDHKDGDKSNNRISNLRLCSDSENKKNMDILASNTSGYKGVSWHKASQKWRVTVWLDNKARHLGVYSDKNEAISVHKEFCKLHHGEFYRDTTTTPIQPTD